MKFNSLEFALFALVFFGCFPLFKRRTERRWFFLTGMSLVFYTLGEWRYLPFLLLSGQIDYLIAKRLHTSAQNRKALLLVSLALNIGILLICKIPAYGLIENVSCLPDKLPLGVSFYTFQSLSYTFDVYLRRTAPAKNWLHYMAFLSLFPQLLAGPICRARDILPQLQTDVHVTEEDKWDGLYKITSGLFKKVIIADYLAIYVDLAFEGSSDFSMYWFIVITAYSFQLYFDFSGYSDIAIGLSRWIGIKMPSNFNRPYLARGLSNFWKRWHISLSSWFRDYVYVPLGGKERLAVATIITMLLSALWHGLGSGFIVWGLLHAFCLLIEKRYLQKLHGALLWGWSMAVVWHGWILFRSQNLKKASTIVKSLYTGRAYDNLYQLWVPYKGLIVFVLIALAVDLIPLRNNLLKKTIMVPAIMLILFFYSQPKEFIYFRF